MSRGNGFVLLVLAASAGWASVASADESPGAYGGVLVSRFSSNEDNSSPQPKAIAGLIGYTFMPGFSIEGRGGSGLGSDTVKVFTPSLGTVNVGFKVKSYFGGYLRANVPLSDSFNLYGLAGYADGKIEGSALGYTVSATESGFSWFVGGEVKFGPENRQGVGLEWGRVLSSTDALTVLYRFRF